MKSNGTFRNADDSRSVDVSRRKFLAASAVGIAGLGAVGSATAAPDKHTLVITGTGPSTSYSFTVGGNLEKSTADGASINSSDEIVGNSAHGGVGNGTDAYTFTGPLYSFDFDQSGAIDVDLDGEAARVGQRPDHTLVIEGTANYSFATESYPLVSRAYGATIDQDDRRNKYGAAGSVQSGKDAYKYDGELQAFDLDGEARVTIDGKAAHVGQRPDQAVILFTDEEYASAEYEFTVSGSVREVLHDDRGEGADGYTIAGNTVSGSVWGNTYDKVAFDGQILSLSSNHDSALNVYSNYEKLQ
nr:pre-peptidase [Halococcus hamelinensis]